jgi:predicted outer membrane repeat protein
VSKLWRCLTAGLLLAGIIAFSPASTTLAAGVVGTGTTGSCTEAALDTALLSGGAVTFNCGAAPHTIILTSRKTISANTQINGGGLITLSGAGATGLFSVDNGITLELNGMTLSNGRATSGGVIVNNGGAVEITNSTLSSNTVEDSGGAIRSFSGSVTITDSTLSGNSALPVNGRGGAIRIESGTLEITGSTFSGNTASTFGGAIMNEGTVTITDSTLSGNSAGNTGGAIDSAGTMDIVSSTLTGNMAATGGAIYHNSGSTTITAGTLSGNSAQYDGGAISTYEGTVEVTASTLSENTAGFEGSAVVIDGPGSITFAASIIDGSAAPGVTTCTIYSGTITSLGSNLSDDDTCSLTAAGDIPSSGSIDLGPLQNNGGATGTMKPLATSDAIDNADCNISTAEDQRGIDRPQGISCDIGAVEVQALPGSTYPLCVSSYTGLVSSPLYGDCGVGQVALQVTADQNYCIDLFTGRVSYLFGRPCPLSRMTHSLLENGDLLTCINRYTGANRRVSNHSQCGAYEVPNTISATP